MVNSSLAYEVLMYLNGFYFGLFATCELGMGMLKFVNLQYDKSLGEHPERNELIILLVFCLIESVRIHLGSKGSLSEHAWQVWASVVLTIPVIVGVVYLLIFQAHVLKLEYILGGLMFALLLTELTFAIIFLFTMCKTPTYD